MNRNAIKIPQIIKNDDRMYMTSVGCVVRIENAINISIPVKKTPAEM